MSNNFCDCVDTRECCRHSATKIYRLKKYRDTGIPRYFVTLSIADNFCKNPTVRIICSALTDSICHICSALFCSLAFLDPRVGHTMDVLPPFISILCHSD